MLSRLFGKSDNPESATPLYIGPEDIQRAVPEAYYLLDLRDLKEYREGHIKGSHRIPYGELAQRMHELPKNRTIVTIANTDGRARQVAKRLRKEGYRARVLTGGILQWPGKLVK